MSNGKSCSNLADNALIYRYLDKEGRVKVWPAKRKKQQMVANYLTRGFKPDTRYTETQVNEILMGMHTFVDYAILRRTLCDEVLLARSPDGSAYWLTEKGQAAREVMLKLSI